MICTFVKGEKKDTPVTADKDVSWVNADRQLKIMDS